MTEKRLLVVDDEPGFGELVREIAEESGYQVGVTLNARDFKRAYEDLDPTVVVLDIVMPETDGIELIHWLADKNSRAKLIVVTGFNPRYAAMAEVLGRSQGLGEVVSLAKPFKVADLRLALR